MQTATKTYKFIGTILPDGHLSVPSEIAAGEIKEYEVSLAPVDEVKKLMLLYLEGRLEKSGRFEDIAVNAAEMEQAVKDAFGTTDLDAIMDVIRR